MTDLIEQLAHHREMLIYRLGNYQRALEVEAIQSAANNLNTAAVHATICTELRAMIAEDPTHD